MVDSVNNIQYSYYNTINKVKSTQDVTNPIGCDSAENKSKINTFANPNINFGNSDNISGVRTKLVCKKEIDMYNEIINLVDKNTRKQLDALLKSGILLNANSNDGSSVLDNLHLMVTTPRAEGLDGVGMLKDTVNTLASPYNITQQFGDIPSNYRREVVAANDNDANSVDVLHSGTCVAASIEFNLAQKMPAEFARFAQGLSSQNVSVDKKIELKNLTDNTLDSLCLLNAFEIPYKCNGFNDAILTFAPDKNAILRARIQTTDKDPLERTPLDVLMQSTFMQVGSQQSYNTITDKREGKFNQNDKGLIEFEKTFTESVVTNSNKLSMTYQNVDENARLVGYQKDFETIKKHISSAIDMGENVIIGYTLVDKNNIIINGHEITITGYKTDSNGKMTFICNDTDDNLSKPIEYSEDYLVPKIHHAALPQCIVENEFSNTPLWAEGLNSYKQSKVV